MVALAAAGVAALAASTHRATAARGAMTPAIGANPKYDTVRLLARANGTVLFNCQRTNPAGCYGPDQIRVAYGIQPLLDQGFDGHGRTIAIIDAYGSPTLASDVATFDALWGLPAPDLTVLAPFGIAATTPDNALGWSGETSLDVEWAHAVAPGAKIVLVVARSSDDADILDALQYVVDNNLGDVLSQSYGEAEQCMAPELVARQHALFDAATAKGTTLFAASGDQGAGEPDCNGDGGYFKAVSTPASDPDVTAVGATTLHADGASGAYQSESAWNESALFGDAVASGGGVSVLYRRPDFQAPVVKDTHAREVPDVAFNAAVFNGVIVVWNGGFFRFGGTSSGSPQWAAVIAIADQMAGGRVGAINKTLYKLGRSNSAPSYYHDVTAGDNGIPDLGAGSGTPIAGFAAGPGWDAATGWGSPIASALVPAIAKPGIG